MTLQHYQEDIRNRLLNYWRMRRVSMATLRAYRPALDRLLDALPVYFDEFETDDLIAYLLNIQSRGARDLQITMIRAVYRVVHGIDLDWRLFPYLKQKRKIQPRFSQEEVQQMIDAIDNIGHKLLLLTQFATGCRVGELVCLKVRDIYREPGCVFIDGEGIGNDRFAPLIQPVYRELVKLTAGRPEGGYIWPGQGGGHLSERTVQKVLTKAKEAAGVNAGCNTHGLRRGFGTEFMKAGGDVLVLQRILGHEWITTTQVYVGDDPALIREAVNPAAGLKVA